MISRLEGVLIHKIDSFIVLDVHKVGYEVELSMRDINTLPTIGQMITLYTHMVIRDDFHGLYGFLDILCRDCFRVLIKVSGIGPKIALSILGCLEVQDLINAIESDDIATITMANGVGKKMAERLVLELKGKISSLFINLTPVRNNSNNYPDKSLENDLTTALFGLGFLRHDIIRVIKLLPNNITSLDIAIKESLKILGNK